MTTFPATVQQRLNIPPGGRSGDAGSTITPGDVLGMLRRRLVMAIVLTFFFAVLSGGGLTAWWFVWPGYSAECLIECVSNVPDTGLTFEQERLRQEEHERFVLSQALLIKSPLVLGEALKLSKVRETSWFKSWEPDRRLIELTEDLSAAPVRGSNYLRVAIETHDPKDPATIVNEVVGEWYRVVKARSADWFASAKLEEATNELQALDAEIEGKRDRMRTIAGQLPAGARLNPAENSTSQEVKQLLEQVTVLQLELSQLEQYRALYNSPEGVVSAEERQLVEQDPEVAELSRTAFLLRQQRAADARVYGDEHAELKRLDAQIAAVEEKLDQARLQKFEERRADLRQAAGSAYLATQNSLLLAQERLLKAEDSLQDQDQRLFEYDSIEKDIEERIKYRNKLEEYISSLRRVKDRQMAVNVNVAQPATDPLQRSSPNLYLMIPFGVFLSVSLGLGISLGVELLDKSVRTAQDVGRHLDLPVLGAVPDVDDDETAIERVELAVRDHPRSLVAEAFRQIRAGLQFSAPIERQKTVLVASPNPSDGRTTIACNLSAALAQAGRRVLLVDANLRRPGLQGVFTGLRPKGLSNILIGDGTLADGVSPSGIARLDVLGTGPLPPNPAELLGGERFRSLLAEAAASYDQVIIDSPPALLASDAAVLSSVVDGVVVVVRARANSRGAARRAVGMLHGVGAHILGGVLNAARVTRGGYYREQLRSFYDYQQEEESAGGKR